MAWPLQGAEFHDGVVYPIAQLSSPGRRGYLLSDHTRPAVPTRQSGEAAKEWGTLSPDLSDVPTVPAWHDDEMLARSFGRAGLYRTSKK